METPQYVDDRADYVRDNYTLKLSLCLIKNQAMKTYGGLEVKLHPFSISAVD
jgi:hypothetical protein